MWSVFKSEDELSIVCNEADIPAGVKYEKGWKAIKVDDTLSFELTGILSSLASPLADAGISIFAISSFNTDYILIKQMDLQKAISILLKANHNI